MSNAQYIKVPNGLEIGSGRTPTACKDNALANLSAIFRDYCTELCRIDPNNGVKHFEFPDHLIKYPVEPYFDSRTREWQCQAQVDKKAVICECRKKTPPPTPTPIPTPTPVGIYGAKDLEGAILGAVE